MKKKELRNNTFGAIFVPNCHHVVDPETMPVLSPTHINMLSKRKNTLTMKNIFFCVTLFPLDSRCFPPVFLQSRGLGRFMELSNQAFFSLSASAPEIIARSGL
ncbi:MAG: hypothetical protein OEV92_01285 [Nitrospinota bacterium]|nr:hypothetical protein [Nitrospinota bacterium]